MEIQRLQRPRQLEVFVGLVRKMDCGDCARVAVILAVHSSDDVEITTIALGAAERRRIPSFWQRHGNIIFQGLQFSNLQTETVRRNNTAALHT